MGVWKKFGLKKNFSSTPPSNLNYDWSLSTERGLQGTLLKRGLKLKLDIPGFPFSSVNQETLETRLAFSLFCVNAVYNLWQIRKFVRPLPPTSPQARMGKWRALEFARLHPWFGRGVGGMAVEGSILFCPRLYFNFLTFCQLSLFATFSEEISCKLQKSQLLVQQIYR